MNFNKVFQFADITEIHSMNPQFTKNVSVHTFSPVNLKTFKPLRYPVLLQSLFRKVIFFNHCDPVIYVFNVAVQ